MQQQIGLDQIRQDGATDTQVIKWNNGLLKWEAGTAASSSKWTDAGAFTYLTATTDRVLVGSATELNSSYGFQAGGGAYVRGAGATGATLGLKVDDSGSASILSAFNDGEVLLGKDFTIPSNAAYATIRTGPSDAGAITLTNGAGVSITNIVAALASTLTYAGTDAFTTGRGVYMKVNNTNTSTSNSITGVYGEVTLGAPSARANTLIAGEFRASTGSATAGTVSELAALKLKNTISSGVTATVSYGLYIQDLSNAGTSSNTYGLYIGDVTSGTQPANSAYGIFSQDTNALSYIGGKLGINVTVPTARLELGGGTTTVAPAKFTSGTNLTTLEAGAVEWDGARLYITTTAGPTRQTLAYMADISGASIVDLDNIAAATATNSIDNLNFNQTWTWSTIGTGTAFSWDFSGLTTGIGKLITANAITSGTALSVSSSNASINSTAGILYVANEGASTSGRIATFKASTASESGVFIMANGRMGIGEDTPAEILHLGTGTIRIASLTTSGAINTSAAGVLSTSKVFITPPATNATITLADTSALVTVGPYSSTFTMVGPTTVTFPTVGTLVTLTGAETLTNKSINLANNTVTGTTALFQTALSDDDFATLTNTVTLTNKAITKRVSTTASSATPTPTASTDDMYTVTALAANATFGSPGAGTNGQGLIIRIKDNGTSRTLAFNAVYRFSTDIPAPSATTISQTMYLGFIYNTADSKWDCVSKINGFA